MLKQVTTDIPALRTIEERLRWLSAWTIHHANHVRASDDGLKVGGHQAICASMTAIMAALYFHALGPNDRVAVKPHAGPVLHAIHYLLGSQSREALENFRGFGGAQSYPSRTKDRIPVDFSTGSVGLGVAITALRQPGAGLSQRARLARGARPRAVRRADRRCRARRGQYLRSADRGRQARRPQLLVDRRLQPPEPRRDQRRPDVRALRRDFRELRLARRRACATASGSTRRCPEHPKVKAWLETLPNDADVGAHLSGRRGVARAHRSRPRQGRRALPQGA